MTTTLKLVSIPMAVVILAAVYLVVLPRDLPTINLPAAAPAAEGENLGLYDMTTHTDKEHDPYFPGSEAQYIVEDVQIGWPGGPGDDWKCFTIRLAGKIMREVYWHAVSSSYGDLAWFDYETGLWGGAYPYKVKETVGNLPKDLRNKGFTIESGCGNPPPFTPAH